MRGAKSFNFLLNTSNEGHTAVYLRTIFARDNKKTTIESTKVGISQRGGPSACYRLQDIVKVYRELVYIAYWVHKIVHAPFKILQPVFILRFRAGENSVNESRSMHQIEN